MKQNERLLVYAVTGFLAVILVVAVWFGPGGREAAGAAKPASPAAKGLAELIGQQDQPSPAGASGAEVLPAPGELTRQQPLVAVDAAAVAAELLAQQLGPSQRSWSTRLVRARPGDSLELLVRRWCGARDPFLAEAKAMNEDLGVLRAGQEVCLPWVDDAVLLAALEANQPKPLAAASDAGVAPAGGGVAPIGSLQRMLGVGTAAAGDGAARPAEAPAFAEPGRSGTAPAARRAVTEYTVQSGDSLWKIAERSYGRQQAARMVRAILEANPGLDERVKPGQKLVLPPAP
ncbi:MAG: LysM peptidoglycan-binding domain-containing protein [Planctomycetes bacterium]|nr:LysM peptidoglycan-binding domain-containing protein [Planctomycetota bacterium]